MYQQAEAWKDIRAVQWFELIQFNPCSICDFALSPLLPTTTGPACLPLLPQDPNALVIGQQSSPRGVKTFSTVQDCVTACDDDGATCVGVTLEMTVDRNKLGTTCKLVRGDSRPGRFKRTVVRTELSRVGFPTSFLW